MAEFGTGTNGIAFVQITSRPNRKEGKKGGGFAAPGVPLPGKKILTAEVQKVNPYRTRVDILLIDC